MVKVEKAMTIALSYSKKNMSNVKRNKVFVIISKGGVK